MRSMNRLGPWKTSTDLPLANPVPHMDGKELSISLALPERIGSAEIRIFRRTTALKQPCIIYLHGGYFHNGSIDDAVPFSRALSSAAIVIAIGYPLAPAVFPAPLETCFSVLEWVARNARRLQVDPQRIYLGGDQAGGNLAASLAMICRDRLFDHHGRRQIRGQILITPLLDPAQATPSLREVAVHPARRAWSEYLSQPSDFLHPYASPLRSRRLRGLPAVLLVTADRHPLRDEAQLYATQLRKAGVEVLVHSNSETSQAPVNAGDPGFAATVAAVQSFLRMSSSNSLPSK